MDLFKLKLEALQQSTCFGIAYDETVPECGKCDVSKQCKYKSETGENLPTPSRRDIPVRAESDKQVTKAKEVKGDKPSPDKPKKPATNKGTKTSAKKEEKKYSSDMPEFKDMSLEELVKLAKDRGVSWKQYDNANITRMRLIMALKTSYSQ